MRDEIYRLTDAQQKKVAIILNDDRGRFMVIPGNPTEPVDILNAEMQAIGTITVVQAFGL